MKIKSIILSLSIFFNMIFIIIIFYMLYKSLDGYPEARNGKYGILKENIEIGRFDKKEKIFSLPKGIIVKDTSAVGMDWFEPNRFKIIITSNREDLVDYAIDQKIAELKGGEYYSAENNE